MKISPTRPSIPRKSQAIDPAAEKFIQVFNSLRTLGVDAGQFAAALHTFKKAGIVSGSTAAAWNNVFRTASKVKAPAQIAQKLAQVSKDFTVVNRGLSALGGFLNVGQAIAKGDYPGAAGEFYKAALSMGSQVNLNIAINAALTVARELIPGFKGSKVDQFFGVIDLAQLGGIGVESLTVLMKAFCKGTSVKELDQLVKKMKNSGAGLFVKIGEKAGSDTYDIVRQLKTSGRQGYKAYLPTFLEKMISR